MRSLMLTLLAGCSVAAPQPPARMVLENVRSVEYLDNGRVRVTFDNDAVMEYWDERMEAI